MEYENFYSHLNYLKKKRFKILKCKKYFPYLYVAPFVIHGCSFVLPNSEFNENVTRYLVPIIVSLASIKKGVNDNIKMKSLEVRIRELQLLYKQQYENEEVILIGGNDSIGVPYTRDNIDVRSHFDVVRDFFYGNGINPRTIDMYSMAKYNTTESFEQYLKYNISLAQIKMNQRESIDLYREQSIYKRVQLRSNMKDMYVPDEYDYNHNLTDEIKKGLPIVIYSCGTNEFFKELYGNYYKTSSRDYNINNVSNVINKIIPKIERNINLILSLNPNAEIYILGLYEPLRKDFRESIMLFNSLLRQLCSCYPSVHYVDNMNVSKNEIIYLDFNPNMRGQELIGSNIVCSISENSKILSKRKNS
jgi:hypothetical protein